MGNYVFFFFFTAKANEIPKSIIVSRPYMENNSFSPNVGTRAVVPTVGFYFVRVLILFRRALAPVYSVPKSLINVIPEISNAIERAAASSAHSLNGKKKK